MADPEVDLRALEAHLRQEGASVLLPARLTGSVRLSGEPVVRDALTLPGGTLLVVVDIGDEVVVTPVVAGHTGARRASEGDGAFSGVARVIAAGARVGRFEVRVVTPVPPGQGERTIDVDQSNDSMVVGDGVVVKIYARTAPGPQPGLDLPAHLAEVGFERTPVPYGSLVWVDDAGREVLVATASRYLPGAQDGWDWYVDLLLQWVDDALGDHDVLEPAAEVGRLVAQLHRALATPSGVFPEPLSTADRSTVEGWRARAESTLGDALEIAVETVRPSLREIAPRIREAFEAFGEVDETPVMRIHGDLHVGQVLRWDEGYAVSDFDGNPLAPVATRVAPDTPARDVASMARAIDHVGRVAQRRRPGREADVEEWIVAARTRFLDAYRDELGSRRDLFDTRLLFPLEVAQECHEHLYAARYLPRWSYVPDLALPVLLEAGS